jgi:hypothetical protein
MSVFAMVVVVDGKTFFVKIMKKNVGTQKASGPQPTRDSQVSGLT